MSGFAAAGMSTSATAGSNKVRGDQGFEPDQLGGQELHRTKRPLPETAGSPTKRSGHGDGLVDIGTLRALMAEQSAMLLESQQRHLHQMLEKRDVEFQERFGAVDARMDRQDGQIADIRRMVTSPRVAVPGRTVGPLKCPWAGSIGTGTHWCGEAGLEKAGDSWFCKIWPNSSTSSMCGIF